jgi:predicted ATP-binding protein involved in virulence
LIRDWITWQFQRPETLSLLAETIEGLSPSSDEIIRPGKPMRLYIDDAREFPTITLPYGTVPAILASAGMKRILALAYLLVWTWTEHLAASELRREEPTNKLLFLWDEVESHLHPQWQRVILPALLKVVERLRSDIHVQVLATTHAPLVLASLETVFDEQRDRVFTFKPHNGTVNVAAVPWAKQGDQQPSP